jgi:hypothetical protein
MGEAAVRRAALASPERWRADPLGFVGGCQGRGSKAVSRWGISPSPSLMESLVRLRVAQLQLAGILDAVGVAEVAQLVLVARDARTRTLWSTLAE